MEKMKAEKDLELQKSKKELVNERLEYTKQANLDDENMQKRMTAKQPTHDVNTMPSQNVAMMSVIARENNRFIDIKKFQDDRQQKIEEKQKEQIALKPKTEVV